MRGIIAAAGCLVVTIQLAIVGGIIYVAAHFIAKVW